MYTPNKYEATNVNETGHGFQTPYSSISFSRELRHVLQERNLLTAKSRKRVCDLLNGSKCSSSCSPNPDVDKRENFRMQAIQEIITSERAYLAQLELLMKFFIQPLKEEAVIDCQTNMLLFGHIELIYNLNGQLLRELENNMENVARAFLKMAPFLKLYSVYAFDYRNALLLLQELTGSNAVFRTFLEKTETRPEVQRKLNSLMIVPIQRVPRYKLLLEQVLLYTSPADADFKLLRESVKEIESTASHINSCIENQEITIMLINLQNSLVNRSPKVVKPSRKVIKEGVLQKITRTGTQIKRYCVLMSDIFMYCKVLKERAPNTVVENSLECCCIFPLRKSKVYELFPGHFKITCQGDGIILSAMDLQVARVWIDSIRDAIDVHIQCRRTLRKESSKRKPVRRKDIKYFDEDLILSPGKKKWEYETVFRNKNRGSDSESEADDETNCCFPHTKVASLMKRTVPIRNNNHSNARSFKTPSSFKRNAPPEPNLPSPSKIMRQSIPNCLAKGHSSQKFQSRYKYSRKDKTTICDKLKQKKALNSKSTLNSHLMSYLNADNVDNTIPKTLREDLFDAGLDGDTFRDILYPLRSSGGSSKGNGMGTVTWSRPSILTQSKENDAPISQAEKKYVKFNFMPSDTFQADNISTKMSLTERICNFFANIF